MFTSDDRTSWMERCSELLSRGDMGERWGNKTEKLGYIAERCSIRQVFLSLWVRSGVFGLTQEPGERVSRSVVRCNVCYVHRVSWFCSITVENDITGKASENKRQSGMRARPLERIHVFLITLALVRIFPLVLSHAFNTLGVHHTLELGDFHQEGISSNP